MSGTGLAPWRSPAGGAICGRASRLLARALAVLWIVPGVCAASPPRFVVEVDRGTLEIADRVQIHLFLEAPALARVALPGRGASLGPFELLEAGATTRDTLASGSVLHGRRLLATVYQVGSVTLPPLPARVVFEDTAFTVLSDSVTVLVSSMIEAAGADSTADIHALKGIVDFPMPGPRWPLVGLAAVIGASALWFWVWRRLRARRLAGALGPVDLRPADEWALSELRSLRALDLPAAGELAAHYSSLTDIVRPYLERRFHIHAADRTSAEILLVLRDCRDAGWQPERAAELRTLLEGADLVKFARHRPPVKSALGDLDAAVEFVRLTAPSPVVLARAASAGGES